MDKLKALLLLLLVATAAFADDPNDDDDDDDGDDGINCKEAYPEWKEKFDELLKDKCFELKEDTVSSVKCTDTECREKLDVLRYDYFRYTASCAEKTEDFPLTEQDIVNDLDQRIMDGCEHCTEDKNKWHEEYVKLGTDKCIDASKPLEEQAHSFDCSAKCQTNFNELMEKYDGLTKKCENFKTFNNDQAPIYDAIKDAVKDMCNECTLAYRDFVGVYDEMKKKDCIPSKEHVSCDADCIQLVDKYQREWQRLLTEGVCKPYSPGGCGVMGGMSEGEVYDKLVAMTNDMPVYSTLSRYCDPQRTCKAQYIAWYTGWVQVAGLKDHNGKPCINFPFMGLTTATPEMAFVNTSYPEDNLPTISCSGFCRAAIENKISRAFFRTVKSECHGGQPTEQLHHLRLTLGQTCADPEETRKSTGILSSDLVLDTVIVLSIFFSCVIVALFLIITAINYCRGVRGLDMYPNFFYWKSMFPAAKKLEKVTESMSMKMRKRQPGEDEEQLMYSADDDN